MQRCQKRETGEMIFDRRPAFALLSPTIVNISGTYCKNGHFLGIILAVLQVSLCPFDTQKRVLPSVFLDSQTSHFQILSTTATMNFLQLSAKRMSGKRLLSAGLHHFAPTLQVSRSLWSVTRSTYGVTGSVLGHELLVKKQFASFGLHTTAIVQKDVQSPVGAFERLNTKKWSKEEDECLLQIIKEHSDSPDRWVLASETLLDKFGIYRSDRACTTHHHHICGHMAPPRAWTKEEDKKLIELYKKRTPLIDISEALSRSTHSVQKRHTRLTNPLFTGVKRGPYSDKESEIIRSMVEEQIARTGAPSWRAIGKKLNRDEDSVRIHYDGTLSGGNGGPFTLEEVKTIQKANDLVAQGGEPDWRAIAATMDRSVVSVKGRAKRMMAKQNGESAEAEKEVKTE
ncbi:hypothetical protein DFS34DRAFT_456526 [Phlyctochytrium arcticum]|nr:hypothetical protein DFS34DRAFT_456526 [Phlyctochytrium arcticum]